jgi:integrase
MNKIESKPRITKIKENSVFYEIKLSKKGNLYRARTSSLTKIYNIKNSRPEATSKYSFDDAINKLIPKIKFSLSSTNTNLGEISTTNNGKILFSVETVINDNTNSNYPIYSSEENVNTTITMTEVTSSWLKYLYGRTKKDPFDEEYLSPTTLEKNYVCNVNSFILPYLANNPCRDNINIFSELDVDKILLIANGKEAKRMILLSLKLIFDFATKQNYIQLNPIKDKKMKKKKQTQKEYSFIEDEDRALWINCMLKEIYSEEFKKTYAALSFLFALLHGTRPEETCGLRWCDINFEKDDIHIRNAYKNVAIYDTSTMKRIGWKKEDGPLKTPESCRHIPLDILIKNILIEHKKNQQEEYKKRNKIWSEDEYVFHSSSGNPFTPDVLSKNFAKFVKRNNLPHLVLYELRHSFATHCRNCGMEPEVLAVLMGHTEYKTTQKYYVHVSTKQKREESRKIQNKDILSYLSIQNKEYEHLQKNIKNFHITENEISNLKDIQNNDITNYLKTQSTELNLFVNLIQSIWKKEYVI